MPANAIIADHTDMRTRRPARLNGKCVWAAENGTLERTIVGSRHLLRQPPGIAFDAAEYERLRHQFNRIEVKDREKGLIYTLAASDFDAHREPIDRGHGRQYLVRLEHWKATQGEHQPPLPL